MKRVVVLALATILCACASVNAKKVSPAHRPSGIVCELRLTLDYNRIIRHGELIEAAEQGLVLLAPSRFRGHKPRLIRFPMNTVRYGRCEALGRIELVSKGAEADALALQRLALLSRYPQGLSDALLASLLSAYEQPELLVVGVNTLHPTAR